MVLYFENLWSLFVEMSFYIVIGLIFTGLLHAFVKKEAVLKHIGKNDVGSVVKASVVGVPLPLCSCGVVPTAMYLGKSGASKGAVVSFLTSTPQTGVDSIIATYGMIGPLFAIYRPISAFCSGIISGIMTNIFCKKDVIVYDGVETTCGCSTEAEAAPAESSACCCSAEPAPVESSACCCSSAESTPAESSACCCSAEPAPVESSSCCCSSAEPVADNEGFIGKMKIAMTYAFGEFLDEIAYHFVIGLLIAALISTLLPETLLSSITNPVFSMLLMVVIGIPMYICSTASIPIAVSLMLKGISPGAAFVFLFAGPVTNMASLVLLTKTLGKKVVAIYLGSAAVCAILFGLILDYIIAQSGYAINMFAHIHEHEMPLYMTVVAIVFGILVAKSLVQHFSHSKS
ncbi:MAG: SO_0444 family Cu/Zn efflux transporter [Bacillota bacterium]